MLDIRISLPSACSGSIWADYYRNEFVVFGIPGRPWQEIHDKRNVSGIVHDRLKDLGMLATVSTCCLTSLMLVDSEDGLACVGKANPWIRKHR